MVADGFDVDPIRIEHERGIVIRMIVGADARRSIVAAARRKRRFVERVHFGAALGLESDVGSLPDGFVVTDPEIGLADRPKAVGSPVRLRLLGRNGHDQADPERCQRLLIEPLRALGIRNGETDMVQHGLPPVARSL